MSTQMQIRSFLREHHYNKAQEIWRLLDEHPWARRMSQRDTATIAEAQREASFLANDLYHLREELKARLAADDEVAAAVSDVPPGSGDPVEFLAGAVEYARVNHEDNMADWLEGVVNALRAYREARGKEDE